MSHVTHTKICTWVLCYISVHEIWHTHTRTRVMSHISRHESCNCHIHQNIHTWVISCISTHEIWHTHPHVVHIPYINTSTRGSCPTYHHTNYVPHLKTRGFSHSNKFSHTSTRESCHIYQHMSHVTRHITHELRCWISKFCGLYAARMAFEDLFSMYKAIPFYAFFFLGPSQPCFLRNI